MVASAIFFFAAHRVDSRFVQGLVGTYEQSIGEAFYCYLVGSLLLMLVFILSVIGAYHSLRSSEQMNPSRGREQLAPLYPSAGFNGVTRHGYDWKTQV